jgi:hypothetical protein
MEVVSRRYAYSTLQLRFSFMRGLHPFFPPLLEVRAADEHAHEPRAGMGGAHACAQAAPTRAAYGPRERGQLEHIDAPCCQAEALCCQ